MADVLSQSQIDELLKSMQSDAPVEKKDVQVQKTEEETKYSKYDFYSPRKFTKDKMKVLTSVFENYARIMTSQVNGIFRVMTDITVIEVQERRYYEFVNSLSENDTITLVEAYTQDKGKNTIPLMLHVTAGLVITLMNRMLGGGDEVVKVKDDYRYSDVELALYKRITDYFIQALKDGFSNYVNLSFRAERVEENISMIQDVGLDETIAMVLLNVDVTGLAVEKIKICLPGTLLEFIFHLIDNRKHLGRGYSYEDNRQTILDNLRLSTLPVTGQLAKVQLDLNDIYHLHPGDVIDLNKPKNSEVKLFVGKQPWFTGKMGVYKKNMAIRINERIFQEKEDQLPDSQGSPPGAVDYVSETFEDEERILSE